MTPEARDTLLYQAVLAFQIGENAEAENKCRGVLDAHPQFFPALLLQGMIAGKTGRTELGIELLSAAVAQNRRSIEARNELAILLRAAGKATAAIAMSRHAVRLKPSDPGSHNNLALSYLAAGRIPEAIARFKRAIALKPDVAMFHHNLGMALQRQARDIEAIEAFGEAVALDPQHTDALARRGQLLFLHGRRAEALQCYRRAAASLSTSAAGSAYAAEALMHEGRAEEAEECLRQATAREPGSAMAHQLLATVLQRRGKFEEAIASFTRAIELEPRRIAAYVGFVLGKKVIEADRPILQGVAEMLGSSNIEPQSLSQIHYALGKGFDDLGEYEKANRHFDEANRVEAEALRRAGRSFDRKRYAAGIDRMIACFTPDFFKTHRGFGSESDLPVLIVGMPRSGTTLVEQVLSSHSEIAAGGELTFWTDRMPIAELAVTGDFDRRSAGQLADEYCALLGTIAPGKKHVIDKMPANFFLLGLIQLVLPRARIIHCRRNPIDTCLSIYTTAFANALDFSHTRDDIVFCYQQYSRLMAHWRRVLPSDQLLDVDYESMVAEPEGFARSMIAFCGLEWQNACRHPERNQRIITTPSAWQVRQPIYRSSVERWRHYRPWLGAFADLLEGDGAERSSKANG